MARKKQEIALQTEVETQEEWEEMLAKEGVSIVDVYQEWCGPCKAMISIFRRIKNEIGDDLLHFVIAKADTVDALEKYRGKCKPCFLFFAGGVLVEVIRGANAPLLSKSIAEQLKTEHKVLDGSNERKEIRDTEVAADDDREKGAEDEDETEAEDGEHAKNTEDDSDNADGLRHDGGLVVYDSLPEAAEGKKKGVTVAIIKPDVVSAGKVDEILEQMTERGIEILEKKEQQLTEEEARQFYEHKKDEEYFEDLVKFMSSGPSVALVLSKGDTGEGIIDEWRSLLGPASSQEAKETAPESLRAKYGSESEAYVNALHGSDSEDTALRELAFFFPSYEPPIIAGTEPTPKRSRTKTPKKPKIQRTLALIRPDALREKKDEILAKIKESGFEVAMQKEVQLTKEQAEEFYKEHKGQEYFEELTASMSNGPLLALALAREDAITSWREKLGPKEVEKAKEDEPESFRAQFAVDNVPINPLHGSDTPEAAQDELNYFFPHQQTVAVIKPDAFQTKDEIMNRVREAGFHIAARKETELTKEVAEQFYGEHKDKEYFNDLVEHMTSGPSLFMVLTREDAIAGWRSVIGQTDPAIDKEANSESLRAQYGTDIKANALHGSSTEEHAQESIKLVFGDEVEYDEKGIIKDTETADPLPPTSEEGEDEEENKSEEEKAENESTEKDEGGEEEQTAKESEGEEKEDAQETKQDAENDKPNETDEDKNEEQQSEEKPENGDQEDPESEPKDKPDGEDEPKDDGTEQEKDESKEEPVEDNKKTEEEDTPQEEEESSQPTEEQKEDENAQEKGGETDQKEGGEENTHEEETEKEAAEKEESTENTAEDDKEKENKEEHETKKEEYNQEGEKEDNEQKPDKEESTEAEKEENTQETEKDQSAKEEPNEETDKPNDEKEKEEQTTEQEPNEDSNKDTEPAENQDKDTKAEEAEPNEDQKGEKPNEDGETAENAESAPTEGESEKPATPQEDASKEATSPTEGEEAEKSGEIDDSKNNADTKDDEKSDTQDNKGEESATKEGETKGEEKDEGAKE